MGILQLIQLHIVIQDLFSSPSVFTNKSPCYTYNRRDDMKSVEEHRKYMASFRQCELGFIINYLDDTIAELYLMKDQNEDISRSTRILNVIKHFSCNNNGGNRMAKIFIPSWFILVRVQHYLSTGKWKIESQQNFVVLKTAGCILPVKITIVTNKMLYENKK